MSSMEQVDYTAPLQAEKVLKTFRVERARVPFLGTAPYVHIAEHYSEKGSGSFYTGLRAITFLSSTEHQYFTSRGIASPNRTLSSVDEAFYAEHLPNLAHHLEYTHFFGSLAVHEGELQVEVDLFDNPLEVEDLATIAFTDEAAATAFDIGEVSWLKPDFSYSRSRYYDLAVKAGSITNAYALALSETGLYD